jgi:hypothetical protein
MYHWSDATTKGNFELALRGCIFDWLYYIKYKENVNVSLWSKIKPHFESHNDIQIHTIDNLWDFSKLKHEE